jgi:hypothetical protein
MKTCTILSAKKRVRRNLTLRKTLIYGFGRSFLTFYLLIALEEKNVVTVYRIKDPASIPSPAETNN